MSPIRVCLSNMIIFGYHGALAEENALGQRFEIDFEFKYYGDSAIATDQLQDTISYVDIYHLVCDTVAHQQYKLLETLGNAIIQKVIHQYPEILETQIRIRKPAVPLPGVLDHVEVELSWTSPNK
ncbi:dihydroneopterin aldolase [Deltaproteobacteria bacterium TL4]